MSDRYKRIAIDNGMDDIVTRLPRSLVDYILEYMPTRDAARTCILSRKWRYIWSEHPNLVLDKNFYLAITEGPRVLFRYVRYLSAIAQILLLHNGPILKFILFIPKLPWNWNANIAQWLLFLSRNGIKDIKLDNRNPIPLDLPLAVFSCPELTHLEIRNCIFKPPYVFGGWSSNVVTLCFEKIGFHHNMFGPLVPHAPMLESLNFASCTGIEFFKVHAPKLKTFIATDSRNVGAICFEGTPNLTMLSIAPGKKGQIHGEGQTITLSKFLGDLAGIQALRFDGFFLRLADADTVPIVSGRLSVTFNHLRDLVLHELMFYRGEEMSCVLWLLGCSPNLTKLDIRAFSHHAIETDLSYLETPGWPNQMLNQLRTVKITSMYGLKAELLFIKRILANSPLLDTMLLQYSNVIENREGFRISTELLQFTRASPTARIEYLHRK